jgi:hypothetical protein
VIWKGKICGDLHGNVRELCGRRLKSLGVGGSCGDVGWRFGEREDV